MIGISFYEGVQDLLLGPRMPLFTDGANDTVIVALGGRSVTGSIARSAGWLINQGYSKEVIFAGGLMVNEPAVKKTLDVCQKVDAFLDKIPGYKSVKLNFNELPESDFYSGELEADYMDTVTDYVSRQNNDHQFTLSGAQNVRSVFYYGENTGDTFQKLFETSLLDRYNQVIFVTYAPHQYRTVGTYLMEQEKHDGRGPKNISVVPVFPFGVTRDNWSRAALAPLRYFINDEYQKVKPGKGKYLGRFTKEFDWIELSKDILEYNKEHGGDLDPYPEPLVDYSRGRGMNGPIPPKYGINF